MSARAAFIFGYPIGHSISPALHNAAFAARGLEVRYTAREVAPADLARAVEELRAGSVVGANITVPHKEAVLAYVDQVAPEVEAIGAANTIHNVSGRLHASNTDAVGFARSLAEAGIALDGRAVVLLGAGGAARAVTHALLSAGVGRLLIANRHPERAERLARDLRPTCPAAEIVPRSLGALRAVDLPPESLLINTTTVGMHGEVSPIPAELLPAVGTVVDLIYNPPRTRLLREAEAAGLRTLNGLPMLVHQAAAAWEIWMDQPAPLEVMSEAARSALGQQR